MKIFGSVDDDWAILCKCGHIKEEHKEADDYDISQPCEKDGCSCKKRTIETDINGVVLYDKRLS